jgi:hypothetical protein
VENSLKNAVHRQCPKNHSSDFLSEAGTGQKIIPNEKKTTALTNFLVRNCPKNFWLSRLGVRLNLETFRKFEGKEKKQDQTPQLGNPLKIRRFHDVFKGFTKRFPNFPIFTKKLAPIFYKNKILTEN